MEEVHVEVAGVESGPETAFESESEFEVAECKRWEESALSMDLADAGAHWWWARGSETSVGRRVE